MVSRLQEARGCRKANALYLECWEPFSCRTSGDIEHFQGSAMTSSLTRAVWFLQNAENPKSAPGCGPMRWGYNVDPYLPESSRRNKDASKVTYLQLAHNERHLTTSVPMARVIHNLARKDKFAVCCEC